MDSHLTKLNAVHVLLERRAERCLALLPLIRALPFDTGRALLCQWARNTISVCSDQHIAGKKAGERACRAEHSTRV